MEKFSQYFYEKPFIISGLKGKVNCKYNLDFPILNEIGIKNNIHLHVVDWHDKYDALLGSADLAKLDANIDYRNKILKIKDKEIPFYLEHASKNIPQQNLNFNSFLKIPVTIENGDVLIPETKLNDVYTLPECIAYASNGYCLLPTPFEENLLELNCTERLEVAPLVDFDVIDPPKFNNYLNIAELIRTSHLNQEEKEKITGICKTYRDIFYHENCDLSFTNAVWP